MQFDPIVALIITVIVGLITYVYKMHYQSKAEEIDFTTLAPPYDTSLFTTEYPEKAEYEAAKDGKLPETIPSVDEDFDRLVVMFSGASGDNPESFKRKALVALMLKRAMAAVKRGTEIQREIPNVAALEQSGGLKQEEALKIKAGIDAIQEEQKECVTEAESLRPGWGQHIMPMAAQLSMSPEEKKAFMEARAKAMAAAQAEKPAESGKPAAAKSATAKPAAGKPAAIKAGVTSAPPAKAGSPAMPMPQQMPVVNWALFNDSFPERDQYTAAVKGEAPKTPIKESEEFEKLVGAVSGASGDTPESQKRKLLTSLLLKRAIAAVRRDIVMRQETTKIAFLDQAGMLLEADGNQAKKAIAAIQQEQNMIVVEAESLRKGWGPNILPMAFELGVKLEQKKAQRQQQSSPSSPSQSKPTSTPTSPTSAEKASTDKSEKTVEKSAADKPEAEKPADKPASKKSTDKPESENSTPTSSDAPAAKSEDEQKAKVTPSKKKTPKA